IRSLTVKANGTLLIQGPHPCKILCSGPFQGVAGNPSVLIQGQVLAKGANNRGVNSFGTAGFPEPGAAGQVGGGDGGTASFLTTQSTAQGGPGEGAFQVPGGGGQGGESGFNASSDDSFRRPGGGGGGTFGPDVMELFPNGRPTCPDQLQ